VVGALADPSHPIVATTRPSTALRASRFIGPFE
jgi:hypothetical protein